MSNKKLVPELRFPEFVNEGEWMEKKLGNEEISSLVDEKVTIKKLKIDSYISTENMLPGFSGVTMASKLPSVGNFTKFIEEDILISNIRPYLKKIWKSDKQGGASNDVLVLRAGSIVISGFLECLIKNDSFINYVMKGANGVKMPRGDKASIQEYPVQIPSKFEQQKIASCLSSLDELITAYSDKLETLKDHKKGLMQNLFPPEGETVPRYRFPEFVNDGEWIFEKFDKVYFFLVTNCFPRENLNYNKGVVKNIHYGDIHTKFSTLFDLDKETVPYINSDISIDKIRQECYCQEGDLIFADASEDLADVGKCIEIVNLNNERLLSGLHTLLARQIESKLTVGFGGHLFLSNRIRNQMKKEAQGAKVLGISGTRLSNVIIYYPKYKKEQKKIACCLSSLDELIASQMEKIEQLQLHKKGLIQGLFPKLND